MSRYNTGKTYNTSSINGGATYNYLQPTYIIRVTDSISLSDSAFIDLVSISLFETIPLQEISRLMINIENTDYIGFSDETKANIETLIAVLDYCNIASEFLSAMAYVYVTDNQNLLSDSIEMFANIVAEENLNIQENINIDTLIELADTFNLSDILSLLTNIKANDSVTLTNNEDAQTATTDFYIGRIDGLDTRFQGISPFDMYFIENESTIPLMPVTESTYIDIPNVDGSIVQNTVYKNRFFTLVAVSMQGMTTDELELLKQKITKSLDSAKTETKELTFTDSDTVFDVRYSGQASIQRGASWLKASLPFEAQPYAKKLFPVVFSGSGIIINDGDANLGPVVTISGGCSKPNFTIGTMEFLWNDTVPDDEKLIIDNENMTCYLIDDFGTQTNAMNKLTYGSDFIQVAKGESMVVTALDTDTKTHMSTEYNPLILWYGKTEE